MKHILFLALSSFGMVSINASTIRRNANSPTSQSDNPTQELVRCHYQTFDTVSYDDRCARLTDSIAVIDQNSIDANFEVSNYYDPNSVRNTNGNSNFESRNENEIQMNNGCTFPGVDESRLQRFNQKIPLNVCSEENPAPGQIPAYPVFYYVRNLSWATVTFTNQEGETSTYEEDPNFSFIVLPNGFKNKITSVTDCNGRIYTYDDPSYEIIFYDASIRDARASLQCLTKNLSRAEGQRIDSFIFVSALSN
eukprot:Awhi_evm1s4511